MVAGPSFWAGNKVGWAGGGMGLWEQNLSGSVLTGVACTCTAEVCWSLRKGLATKMGALRQWNGSWGT